MGNAPDNIGPKRNKDNSLEDDIKKSPINYLYGGGYYVLKHIKQSKSEVIESEGGAAFCDIYLLVESIQNTNKMQQLKVISDYEKDQEV